MSAFKKSILFLSVFLTLVSCVEKKTDKSTPLKVINIGYIGATNARILVAQRDSLFEKVFAKKGIKINFVQCNNGPIMIETFLANKIDVAVNGDQPAVLSLSKGIDIKAVANFNLSQENTRLMVRDSVHIKTLKDLKGKRVAILIGGLAQHWLYLVLKKAGIPYTDVKMVNLEGEAVEALAAKTIDAAVLSEPSVSICESKHIAAQLKNINCPKLCTEILLVSGNIYRNHPEIIEDLISVYQQANDWVIDHPIDTVDLIGTKITYKVPKEIIYKQYLQANKNKNLAFTDSAVVNLKEIVSYLKDLKAIPQKGTIADNVQNFYDPKFVDDFYRKRKK
jgi:aliphatic sulfonates family ABC transporter substrate-binding protein